MDQKFLNLNIKNEEGHFKEEILDFRNDKLQSEDDEQYMLMNTTNESRTIMKEDGDLHPIYLLKEEEVETDPLALEGFSSENEESKYPEVILEEEEELAENDVKMHYNFDKIKTGLNVKGIASGKEEESKMTWESSCQRNQVLIGKQDSRFKCDLCSYGTNERSNLLSHHLVHSDSRPFECSNCDSTFKRKNELIRHLATHSDVKPFKCFHCEATFKRKYVLTEHLAIHSDIKPFKCLHCDSTFKRKNLLKEHLVVHSDIKPFKCSHCEVTFKRKVYLKHHLHVHSEVKPFKCPHCESTFTRKHHLKKHSLVHIDMESDTP